MRAIIINDTSGEMFEESRTYIRAEVPERTKLEALAEEASELSMAALKLIRAMDLSENYTPVSKEAALANLKEEIGDVYNCITALALDDYLVSDASCAKMARWAERVINSKKNM